MRAPTEQRKLLAAARDLVAQGKPDTAIELYEEAVEERWDDREPYERLAGLYEQLGCPSDAERVLRAALERFEAADTSEKEPASSVAVAEPEPAGSVAPDEPATATAAPATQAPVSKAAATSEAPAAGGVPWLPIALVIGVLVVLGLVAGIVYTASQSRKIDRLSAQVGDGGATSKARASDTPRNTRAAAPETGRSSEDGHELEDLVEEVGSGVLRLEVSLCGSADGGLGTGFLIGPRLIATNEHVIEGAQRIEVKQGEEFVAEGRVIGYDRSGDVALVRTDAPIKGHVFSMMSREPRMGERVAALGYPLGLPLSLSQGAVSGTDRKMEVEGEERRSLVQTDTPVNPGNSGGPLLSMDGEVIGIVTATNSAGIGLAVSADYARPLLERWRAHPDDSAAQDCSAAGSDETYGDSYGYGDGDSSAVPSNPYSY